MLTAEQEFTTWEKGEGRSKAHSFLSPLPSTHTLPEPLGKCTLCRS